MVPWKSRENRGKFVPRPLPGKPYGISESQDLEPERDTVVYEELYDVDGIIPRQIKVKRSWKWIY